MNKESFSQIQTHLQPEWTILYSTAYLCAWCHFHLSCSVSLITRCKHKLTKEWLHSPCQGVTVLCGCDVSTVRSSCWRQQLFDNKYCKIQIYLPLGISYWETGKICQKKKIKEDMDFHDIDTPSHLVQIIFSHREKKTNNKTEPSICPPL